MTIYKVAQYHSRLIFPACHDKTSVIIVKSILVFFFYRVSLYKPPTSLLTKYKRYTSSLTKGFEKCNKQPKLFRIKMK